MPNIRKPQDGFQSKIPTTPFLHCRVTLKYRTKNTLCLEARHVSTMGFPISQQFPYMARVLSFGPILVASQNYIYNLLLGVFGLFCYGGNCSFIYGGILFWAHFCAILPTCSWGPLLRLSDFLLGLFR